jgi:hypothetical protein
VTHLKHEKYITLAIVVGFTAQIFCYIMATILYPPDYSTNIPKYAPESSVILQLGFALFIFGATVMAIKLADEKKVLAAAGFTMLAISTGVIMASVFETTTNLTEETFEKSYCIVTSSNFLYLPAMLLISACDEFKKWVRILGLISAVPLWACSFLFLFHYRNFTNLDFIGITGYVLMMFTQLMWAINVYNNHRRKMKASNN